MSEAFLPTLRRKLTGTDPYGLDNSPTQDEITGENPYSANAYKPSLATPGITNAPPSSAVQSQQNPYAARLTDLGNQLQSAYAAPHAGAARQLLGALFSRKNPQLGGIISGETQRERQIEPMEKEYGLISNIIAANRAQQTADTTNQMHLANTNYLNKHADVLENPPIKPTPQEEAVKYYMTQIDPATKKLHTPASALRQVNQDAQDVKPSPVNHQGLEYDPGTGIPISYTDENQQKYDVNDPSLPAAGKALVKNALGAHSQHVKEQSDAQARSAAAANQRQQQTFSRQDVTAHDKAYVQPAEQVEKSYQMMNDAYNEYKQAKAEGKELPTGAQSMLALSSHLATTFGNVKGARITKDMIEHHLGARGISDSAQVAIQRLTNGDVLSPDQWSAFHDLIGNSRKLSWNTAVKEAKRKSIPVDFLPKDLGGLTGEETGGASSGGAYSRPKPNVVVEQ